MRYRSQRFDPDKHDVSEFACGEPSLDAWLREQAAQSGARRTARTWVWVDPSGAVVGYYALAAHKVARSAVPGRIGRGGPVEIPAVLVARLALSNALQGKGLGAVPVAGVLERIVEATCTVGARLVVVDALHENATRFYQSLGFRRIPASLLLVQKIADIEAAITPPV
ncbi:histone acetyltransferase [Mycobacterium sp. M1]|uniref:Histone acetyltransferase n=1 Tax=Mycolicibacter acidiphilus TaxID=2835306 RepID=A0ABS5RG92_9MYCO|nr:GNAT family N-acetyltransferase [Mycolicibacter acidiphilus]MBS9533308.1 histone acetyltransferase [Mycolicibacter acidiphilus]